MMKKLFLLAFFLIIQNSFAMTVDEIIDKMEANEQPQSSKIVMKQVVRQANGTENVSELVSYSLDKSDKGIMIYETPKRIKGMKILTLNDGDDIWFYSPRTNRVRKIASHQRKQSVNNSDFSYEDLSAKDLRDDYNIQLLEDEEYDGQDCYKLEMTAKDEDKTYSKSYFWVNKENFVALKAEFYDEMSELWKVITAEEIELVQGYYTPKTIIMKDVQKGSQTKMIMEKVEYDLEVDAKMFTQRGLKR